MSTTTSVSESAARWGALWGARAQDWADTEQQQLPTYEEAIRRLEIGRGQHLLDVGCGSGVFLAAAAARGATVSGLDASEPLVEIARRRVPAADVRVGDIERLPFADDTFDVVAGFNAFFFADDMTAALREAGRVARPGAPVAIQVFGRPEQCGLEALKVALGRLMPGPGRQEPPPFWRPGVLEEMASAAGLTPERTFDCRWAFDYPDEPAMVRGMLAAGGAVVATRASGEERVRAAIVEALEPCRTATGGYRIANEWHFLVARA
jgi:SAM-dependent methyltransferase